MKNIPVYLFEGKEEFLKEEALRKFEREFFKNNPTKLNRTLFYGDDLDVSTLASELEAFPMLSSKRLIIIKFAGMLSSSAQELLVSYINKPSPTTCLVLEAETMSKQKKLYKAISKSGRINVFKRYYDNQVNKWISQRAGFYDKKISSEATALLKENIGNNLRLLDEAIKKTALYVGEKKVIGANDVEEIVGVSHVGTVFDLISAIRRRQINDSLKILQELSREGKETCHGIIALLFWQLKRMGRAKKLLGQRLSPKEIGRQLNVHNFFIEQFINEVKGFSPKKFKNSFKFLLAADAEIKTGIRRPEITFELLIVRLCSL